MEGQASETVPAASPVPSETAIPASGIVTQPLTGRQRQLAAIAKYKWKPGQRAPGSGSGKEHWGPGTWIKHVFGGSTRALLLKHGQREEAGKPFASQPVFETLVQVMTLEALAGNMNAARLLFEYGYGAPEQKIAVRTDPERDAWRGQVRSMLGDPEKLKEARARTLAVVQVIVDRVKALPPPGTGNNGHDGNGHDGNGHGG